MKIVLKNFTIREIFDGFVDNEEEGVVGFGGKLNIRPKYQREFVYNADQQRAVINTIQNSLPLNVMYWCKTGDNSYELMDGQQRTLSFCTYCNGTFNVNEVYFHNLPKDKQDQILNYKLFIYICEGSDSEKLEWFKIINIAGEKLTDQELRNAVYSGPWVTNAKRYFSKSGGAGIKLCEKYVKAVPIRQELLEKALKWICNKEGCSIENYMARHQHDDNANELWTYFRSVIEWVQKTFPKIRKDMKQVDWGDLYNRFGSLQWNAEELEKQVSQYMSDSEIKRKSGIYDYVLSGDETSLNLRIFEDDIKTTVYERQKGICPICKKHFEIRQMHADHIKPWSQGGKTTIDNCQMLCAQCNLKKSAN